jgi:hypothetical protein
VPVDLRFFRPLETAGMPDEKVSWNRIKEYLEECWAVADEEIAAEVSPKSGV